MTPTQVDVEALADALDEAVAEARERGIPPEAVEMALQARAQRMREVAREGE